MDKDTQNEQPGVLPDLPDENQPPQPITVDLDSGDVAQPEPEAPRPQAKPRPQARIQNLTHERDQARGYADQLQRELQQARGEATRERAAKEQAERAGMENYAERVKGEVNSAKQALKAAKEANNTDAEVEAHAALARASAAESDVDAWRAGQPAQQPAQPQQQPQQQPRQQAPPIQPLSDPVRDFVQENNWFNPVQIGSDGRPVIDRATGRPIVNPDYDEDLHDAAMLVHKKIAREIKAGRLNEDFVETPEYFARIQNEVAEQFPDAFDGALDPAPSRSRTPPMTPSRQPVAPASRSAIPGQNGGRQSANKIVLSGEERQFVDGLVANGTLRYPRTHPDATKRGQKMESKDAYVEYAKRAQTERANSQP